MKSHGFTLIEVLVALVIASISATILFEVISTSVGRRATTANRQAAILLAESKISELGWIVDVDDLQTSGLFENGMLWSLSLSRMPDIAQLTVVEIVIEVGPAPEGRPIRIVTNRWLRGPG